MQRSRTQPPIPPHPHARARPTGLFLGLTLASLASACDPTPTLDEDAGTIEGRDAAATEDAGACGTLAPLTRFFATEGCIACHAGATSPDLRNDALAGLLTVPSVIRPGRPMVVAGAPSESELYLRVAGPLPAGHTGPWFMPLGASTAHPRADVVAQWIEAGAPTACATVEPTPTPTNPNDLDQGALFTCADPTAPTSSPARLRRINDHEFSLASASPLEGDLVSANVVHNPLELTGELYSTHVGDRSIDATTLALLLDTLPDAAYPWTSRSIGRGGRFVTVYDGTPTRFYLDREPLPEHREIWVDRLLRQGVLFRAPTDEERELTRAFLDAELARETDVSQRRETLVTVASAAHLMAGALFRSELGSGPTEGTRRRLSDEEIATALGRVIGAHPVSSTLWGTPPDPSTHPDWSRDDRTDGRLAELRDAVTDGTIGEPETIARLLRRYLGGVDPDRHDITTGQYAATQHEAIRRERGEEWLSQGLQGFFREWLDVRGAEDVFKDTPTATSRWTVRRGNFEATGYALITSRYRRDTLLPLLDDTIARAVIDAETRGEDVLRALLTTRTWRVTSNLQSIDYTQPCTTPADCSDGRDGRCYTSLGFCAAFGSTEVNRVFGLTDDVPDTDEARWVTLPAGERAGVLTHPAWLAAHGGNFEDDASLVHRGLWIREALLCDDVPGLELVTVAAQLGPSSPELRARDRVAMATETPGSACAVCHAEMNPYGNAFELYNHAGYLRATDHGQAPDGSTVLTNAPDPALNRAYGSPIELVEALADSPHVRRCFIRNVFRHFMGRDETLADACTLSRLEAAFAEGSLFDLLESLVTSDAFLYRHDAVEMQ